MDILVQWFDGERWVDDSYISSIAQAVIYAAESAQETSWGAHRVMVDGFLFATFMPMGDD